MLSYRQHQHPLQIMNLSDRDPILSNKLPGLDQFGFHQRLAETRGTALIMFSSPDCGSCRHLRRVLHEVRSRQPLWHLFEVDAQRDPGLANEFEVFHLPTIFVFQDGEFHCQLAAEARTEAIVSATLAALRQPATEAP
jgi:thioredoxin-like negative regulator of GroEL